MAVRKQRLPEPEELFLDYVKRMARHRDGREVLLVHMSQLEPHNRTRHHVELVTTRLGQLARKCDGQVFRFVGGDVACVVHDAPAGQLDNVLFEIRYGFSGDLLVKAEDAGDGVFIQRFDVKWDYESVEILAKERLAAFKVALDASMATANLDEGVDQGHSRGGVVGYLKKIVPKKQASLLDMDGGARKSGSTTPPVIDEPVVAGPLDQWLAENAVTAGGARLPIAEIVRSTPIFDIRRSGQSAAGATLEISRTWLVEAYSRAAGMKMSERLEGFLIEEAETGLVSLLGSLSSSDRNTGRGASDSAFRMSLCLSPQVILSAAFLLEARTWLEENEKGAVFWFEPADFDQGSLPMAYVADFLHEMGHFVGIRGLIPGEVGAWSRRFPQVDGWVLKWPDMDLARAPRGETNGLARALEKWGADRVFLQGLNSDTRVAAAKDFGFAWAECVDPASVKLFTRSY